MKLKRVDGVDGTFDLLSDGGGVGDVLLGSEHLAVLEHALEVGLALVSLSGDILDLGSDLIGFQLLGRLEHVDHVAVPVVELSHGAQERVEAVGHFFQQLAAFVDLLLQLLVPAPIRNSSSTVPKVSGSCPRRYLLFISFILASILRATRALSGLVMRLAAASLMLSNAGR